MSTKIQSSKASKHLGSLLILSTLVAIVSQLFVAAPAKAECQYAGETYQTGEETETMVCMADGSMQSK